VTGFGPLCHIYMPFESDDWTVIAKSSIFAAEFARK